MENEQLPEEKENLFDKMDAAPRDRSFKRFQRSKNNVLISGVCSGIANYINADIGLVRVLALMTLILGGWSIIIYLITAFLMPVDMEQQIPSGEQLAALRRENFRVVLSGILILIGLHFTLVTLGLSSSARIFFMPHSLLFPIAVFFLGIIILINKNSNPSEQIKNYDEKLSRSAKDRRLLGVCGGLGKYLDIDSTSLRIIFIIMTLLTLGVFALLYILIFLLTPFNTDNDFE